AVAAARRPEEPGVGERVDNARLLRVDGESIDPRVPAEPRRGKGPGDAAVRAAKHPAALQTGIDRRASRRRRVQRHGASTAVEDWAWTAADSRIARARAERLRRQAVLRRMVSSPRVRAQEYVFESIYGDD